MNSLNFLSSKNTPSLMPSFIVCHHGDLTTCAVNPLKGFPVNYQLPEGQGLGLGHLCIHPLASAWS